MAKCYQLVGVPGSGKSTWVNSQKWAVSCVYISTDKFVDAHAHDTGKTYNEVFKDFMPHAVKMMADEVNEAREAGKDIIWDQTSVSIASRERKFNMLPNYEHIAVVFKTPEKEELNRRLASRPGKNIPLNVVEQMAFDLTVEPPTLDEGFTEIWYV
jgi:predicted kinase